MGNKQFRIRRLIIMSAVMQMIMMTGCNGISWGNNELKGHGQGEENLETKTENSEETVNLVSITSDVDRNKFILSDEDFEVEYQGYVINEQTSPENMEKNLGLPEDFEDNHDKYSSKVNSILRWETDYPGFSSPDDIKFIFTQNLGTDETYLELVQLYSVKTSRGVMVGDDVSSVYELYGQPVKEQKYSGCNNYLELCYVNDGRSITFGIDEVSGTVNNIYIRYNITGVYIR